MRWLITGNCRNRFPGVTGIFHFVTTSRLTLDPPSLISNENRGRSGRSDIGQIQRLRVLDIGQIQRLRVLDIGQIQRLRVLEVLCPRSSQGQLYHTLILLCHTVTVKMELLNYHLYTI
jgi:hypothetical protein